MNHYLHSGVTDLNRDWITIKNALGGADKVVLVKNCIHSRSSKKGKSKTVKNSSVEFQICAK